MATMTRCGGRIQAQGSVSGSCTQGSMYHENRESSRYPRSVSYGIEIDNDIATDIERAFNHFISLFYFLGRTSYLNSSSVLEGQTNSNSDN